MNDHRDRVVINSFLIFIFVFLYLFGSQLYAFDHEWQMLNERAAKLYSEGQYEQALSAIDKAKLLVEDSYGIESPETLLILSNQSAIYHKLGLHIEAEKLLDKVLGIQEATLGSSDPKIASTLQSLAMIDIHYGMLRKAEPRLKRAISIIDMAKGYERQDLLLRGLKALDKVYQKQGRYIDAILVCERIVSLLEKENIENNYIEMVSVLRRLSDYYGNINDEKVSDAYWNRAKNLIDQRKRTKSAN
jgi:tetratricopeptide (TPR) repeat protein